MEDLENKSQEFQDLYAQANPLPGARAKVPLLEVTEDKEKTLLCESLVVADYVAEQFGAQGTSLLPASAKDRATMRLFTELCGSSFSYFPILRSQGEKQKAALESFKADLAATDTFLKRHKSSPFLFGGDFSLAECNAAPFVQRACAILPALTSGENSANPMEICDELGLVHLKAWMQAILKRPSVIETGVDEQVMVERTTAMLKRMEEMEKAGTIKPV